MNTNNQLDLKKRRLFTLLMLCTPVVLLLLLELLLRLFSYGGDHHLFVTGPEKQISHYWMCNQNVGGRYFYMLDSTPSPPKDLFLKTKPENGYRIFALGGSTTAGFPYSYNLMFPRILNFQLSELFPDRYIEVVNTAMSAVNSYTLLDFMDEIIAKEPDAILIYAGHNEYYGAMGVGSRESFGKNPAFIHLYLQLKKFKTFLLVRDTVGWLKKHFSKVTSGGAEIDPTNTLMARIVGEQQIPYKSDLYDRGLRQFENNLRRILEKAQEHNIPVILSELVSNIKDQPPFISVKSDSFPTAERAFSIGQKLLLQGDVDDARTALYLAKDLDALRFRASEEMNDLIHQLGRQFNVPVVPMKAFFEAQSEHKIIGNELILEHLHPNAKGYFIMANAFLQTMKDNKFIEDSWNNLRSPDEVMSTWGWTELDTVSANLKIHYLKGGWPFQPDIAPNHALENYYPGTYAESLAVHILTEKTFNLVAGHVTMAEYYESKHRYEQAYEEYRAAYYAIPHEIEFYEKAVRNLLQLNEMPKALALLLLSRRYGRSVFTDRWTGLLLADAGRYREALPCLERTYSESPKDVQVLRYLSVALMAEGQLERARQIMANLDSPASEQDKQELLYSVLLKSASESLGKNDYTKALPLLQQAHDIKQTAFTAKWIGLIQLKNGRIKEAAGLLQQAADLTPGEFEVRYNLCNAYIILKQKDNATHILKEMEKLRPGFDDPQNLRGRAAALKSQS